MSTANGFPAASNNSAELKVPLCTRFTPPRFSALIRLISSASPGNWLISGGNHVLNSRIWHILLTALCAASIRVNPGQSASGAFHRSPECYE